MFRHFAFSARGLAGFRLLAVRYAAGRRKRIRSRAMNWWSKVAFPVKRVWVAVTARVKSRKTGRGILELHKDVQTCEYQDVQVMWEMLRTEMELSQVPKRRQVFWKVFALRKPHDGGL